MCCPSESPHRRAQRGVALITALLVVAIATVAAVQIATRQHLDIRRAQNALSRDQAYSYALGAEAGAMALLKNDLFNGPVVHLGPDRLWHKPQMLEYEGAKLVLQVEDLQGRFDLNTLAGLPENPQRARENVHYQRLRTLLVNAAEANPEAVDDSFDPDALISALADWMDPDLNPRPPAGAEDGWYLSLERPYRTANQPLTSPSELMLVKGFTPELVAALEPLVTALPVPSLPYEGKLNVNTAKPEVLRALSPRMSEEMAEQLAKQAQQKPWENAQQFVTDPAVTDLRITPDGINTQSEYFLAKAKVNLGRATVPLYSVIHRAGDKSVKVVRRGRGQP